MMDRWYQPPSPPPVPPYRAGSLEVGGECAANESWVPTRGRRRLSAQGLLPRRVYRGALGAKRRYFAHKLPLALSAERATIVFVQAEGCDRERVPHVG